MWYLILALALSPRAGGNCPDTRRPKDGFPGFLAECQNLQFRLYCCRNGLSITFRSSHHSALYDVYLVNKWQMSFPRKRGFFGLLNLTKHLGPEPEGGCFSPCTQMKEHKKLRC